MRTTTWQLSALAAAAMFAVLSVGASQSARSARAARARSDEVAACAVLTPAATRGKRIFRKGETVNGRPIEGALDGGAAVLRGREAACAGCHSPEGAGTSEGGVSVPAIVAERLFSADRGRDAYDPATLAIAIRDGRSPSRALHLVMPRYRLAPDELDDVIAYLRCVGHDGDPGVSADAVKLGAALPLTGRLAAVGAAIREVLEASFAEVNAQGGIFRRRLELEVEDSEIGGEERAAGRLVDRGVLALVGSLQTGNGSDRGALEARLDAEGVPLIGPVSPAPPTTSRTGGAVFEVEPGLDTLARAAVVHLVDTGAGAAVVVRARGAAGESWLGGARAEAAARALREPVDVAYEPGRLDEGALRAAARRGGARAALYFGGVDDLARCAAALEAPDGSGPVIYAPAFLMGDARGAVPARRLQRVLFVHPGLDETELRGERALEAFLKGRGIAPRYAALQQRARVAAGLVIEALKRTGAHVTRDGVIGALESLRDFDAGAGPALSFGKNRRVGVMGASLVRIDPEQRGVARASGWIGIVP